MKKLIVILLFTFIGSLYLNAQSITNPGEYMNYFSEMYKPIQKNMWDYTSTVAKGKSARKVTGKRQELLQSMAAGERKAKTAKPYKGNTAFRDQVAEWLVNSQIILNEEYGKIMDMEEILEASYDNMEAYIMARKLAGEHQTKEVEKLKEATRVFAEANNVNLLEDDSKLSKKLEQAGIVFDYYDKLYLVFFKSYKQDAYLSDAIKNKDVNAVEQNRQTLTEYAKLGRADLRGIKNINEDGSLKLAGDKMLRVYESYSQKEAEVMKDFFMKEERFNQVKSSFDTMKKKDRTQENVDEYNTAINDFNQAVADYNLANDAVNESRSKALDDWNKSVDKFLSKYAI